MDILLVVIVAVPLILDDLGVNFTLDYSQFEAEDRMTIEKETITEAGERKVNPEKELPDNGIQKTTEKASTLSTTSKERLYTKKNWGQEGKEDGPKDRERSTTKDPSAKDVAVSALQHHLLLLLLPWILLRWILLH
ncbi:uncharacterized protein C1orf54 homolog isoform X2 [Petaurus breviceps papuanus]|uniref:uncharacterized protein C1orf54 homolog isoform X2 n=1 Tax=Petaurus breviceps papuanus TaxID=3040969 RepID=UPI0036DB60B7